jgi:hypothetical protein
MADVVAEQCQSLSLIRRNLWTRVLPLLAVPAILASALAFVLCRDSGSAWWLTARASMVVVGTMAAGEVWLRRRRRGLARR